MKRMNLRTIFGMLTILIAIGLFPLKVCAEAMKIVYANEYPPFCWRDDDGVPKGILIDFLEELLHNDMGILLTHDIIPWKRAQILVRENSADAFFTIPNDERRLYTEVSAYPIFSSLYLMYTGATNPNIALLRNQKSLAALKQQAELGPVDIHRNQMILAMKWAMARKFLAVFS